MDGIKSIAAQARATRFIYIKYMLKYSIYTFLIYIIYVMNI